MSLHLTSFLLHLLKTPQKFCFDSKIAKFKSIQLKGIVKVIF